MIMNLICKCSARVTANGTLQQDERLGMVVISFWAYSR